MFGKKKEPPKALETSVDKLNQANWLKTILKETQENPAKIGFYFDSGSWCHDFRFEGHEHPAVKKFQSIVEEAVKNLRKYIQQEMDGLFK